MGDVINLRQVRKAKVRAQRELAASENRAAFGRSKTERAAREAERLRFEAVLDGARLTEASAHDSDDPTQD
jgi:hypothetical protein